MPVKKMTFGSLFKIITWSQICLWILFAIFWTVLAFVAPESININDVQAENTIEALKGLPILFGVGAMFSLLAGGLGALALKLIGGFLPLGEVNFKE